METLIKRYQEGNSISWSDVGDAASYMIPVYGTYRSFKDAINDPSFTNWGLAGLSLLGDLGYGVGIGAALKGAKASSAAAKAYLGVASNYERIAADIAKEASKVSPKSSVRALKRADNLADDAIGTWKTAQDYRAIAAIEKQGIGRNIKNAGKIAAGSSAAFKGPKAVDRASELDRNKRKSSTQKKTQKKATPSNGDLVKKRTEPFLYNNFQKRNGGTMKRLIPKHDEGAAVRQILDAGEYMIPIYGTYKSWKDVYNEPTWTNLGLAGLSTVGDAALIFGGAGMGLKALNTGTKVAKATEKVNKLNNAVSKLTKQATQYDLKAQKAIKASERRAKANQGSDSFIDIFNLFDPNNPKMLKARSERTLDAAVKADQGRAAAESTRNALLKTQKKQKIASAVSVAAGSGAKGVKAKQGSDNLVEKRKTPYLYNTFQK